VSEPCDGARALLIVQTRAVGSDIDAQQAACQAIRRAFAASLATIPAAAGVGGLSYVLLRAIV
jgi:predicted exporter